MFLIKFMNNTFIHVPAADVNTELDMLRGEIQQLRSDNQQLKMENQELKSQLQPALIHSSGETPPSSAPLSGMLSLILCILSMPHWKKKWCVTIHCLHRISWC